MATDAPSAAAPQGASSEGTLERMIEERRAKGVRLSQLGSAPYRNDIRPTHTIAQVRATYETTKPAPPPAAVPGEAPAAKKSDGITPIDGTLVTVAGRLVARRGFGKTVFAPVRDATGDIQLYLSVEHLAASDFETLLPELDVGDIVAAEGPVFWTKRGEMSVLAQRIYIVTKSLRPLPDKWHGLTDIDLRYRQRYVDLAVSPDVRDVFIKRSRIVRGIREFFDARGFLEVETPMMHPIVGGAAARPFVTHHNALDMQLYMRIAPELYLKRLLVGGLDRVYEINRNFRNEGLSRRHNPEFTMLEFYWAYRTYTELMDLTEELVTELAQRVCGTTELVWEEQAISLAKPWRRITVKQAVQELGGVSPADTETLFGDPVAGVEIALKNGVVPGAIVGALLQGLPADVAGRAALVDATKAFADAAARPGIIKQILAQYAGASGQGAATGASLVAGHLGYLVFEAKAEQHLVQPTFLTQFPLAVSPLARRNEADPAFCDRFELFVCGKEIANGFSELNDPDDQRARFMAQTAAKAAGAGETMDYDADYCNALEVGMPPAAGEGIGIDRLVMMLTNQASIRDVILFPLMRPE